MKLLIVSVHFEFADTIDQVLEEYGVSHYNRYSMVEGKDRDGRHMGTQVYPGSMTVFHAQVQEQRVDGIFEALDQFRQAKEAHRHLEAMLLPIEQRLAEE